MSAFVSPLIGVLPIEIKAYCIVLKNKELPNDNTGLGMKELLSGLNAPVTGIIDKVVTDKDQAAKLAHDIATMADRHAREAVLAQIAVNKVESLRQLVSSFLASLMWLRLRVGISTQFPSLPNSCWFRCADPAS